MTADLVNPRLQRSVFVIYDESQTTLAHGEESMDESKRPRTRPRREPRTNQEAAETKVDRAACHLDGVLKRLKVPPTAPARTSAAYLLVSRKAEEVRAALDRGWSANAIARALVDEVDSSNDGPTFTRETFRAAIVRLARDRDAASKTTRPTTSVHAEGSRSALPPPPPTYAEEDP